MTAVDESVTTQAEFYEFVGNHIKHYRTQRAWTVGELAQLVGVSPRLMAAWEAGSSSLTVLGLCEIADVFGLSVLALLPRGGA